MPSINGGHAFVNTEDRVRHPREEPTLDMSQTARCPDVVDIRIDTKAALSNWRAITLCFGSPSKKRHPEGPEASDEEPQLDKELTLAQRTLVKKRPQSHSMRTHPTPSRGLFCIQAASCSSSPVKMSKSKVAAWERSSPTNQKKAWGDHWVTFTSKVRHPSSPEMRINE